MGANQMAFTPIVSNSETPDWPNNGQLVLVSPTANIRSKLATLGPFKIIEPYGVCVGRFVGNLTRLLDVLADKLTVAEQSEILAATTARSTLDYETIMGVLGYLRPLPQLLIFRMRQRVGHFLSPDALTSYLQPIMRLDDRGVYGYEALLRGQMDGKTIPPSELLTMAKQAGQLMRLDALARAAAVQAKAKHIPPGKKLFINFLPSAIYDPELHLQHTFDVALANGVAEKDLVFEVVETEQIEDIATLRDVFAGYRYRGVSIALDNVGSGSQSLGYISVLKPDFVKITRHLIDGMSTQPAKRAIVNGIARFCQELGVSVVAEGLEKVDDLLVLQTFGIELAQGYLIGAPAPEASAIHPENFKANR